MQSDVMRGVLKRKLELERQESSNIKKQRVRDATYTALDVMNRLLAPDGKVGYEVTDFEWEQLVQLTQQSERFDHYFSFREDGTDWVTTKKKKKKTHLKIVALDCEMCVTQKEGSSDRKTNALCRVSVVDGENLLRRILLDFIVHQPEPGFHMVHPKTDIHGITPLQIATCKITVAQAQKKLLKYINHDTIVVGHSVYGDLTSLRMKHRRVIDTSLIFQRKDAMSSRSTPGLKDLTKFLLGFDMPQGHDSTVDAQVAMMAAKYAVRHETGPIIPLMLELHGPRDKERRDKILYPEGMQVPEEYTGPAVLVASAFKLGQPTGEPFKSSNATAVKALSSEASDIDMAAVTIKTTAQAHTKNGICKDVIACSCRLRVHRISKGLSREDIEKFFVENTNIVPIAVAKIAWLPNQNRGSCRVTFSSKGHAALAFDSAGGPKGKTKVTKDSFGRPQKTIAVVNCKGKTFKNVVLSVL